MSALASANATGAFATSPFPWYALRTKSNHEKTSAALLECKGYTQYVPVYRSRRRWSDRVIEAELPLFPGDFFCRFDARKALPIITTPGVVSILGFGKEPAPVDEAEIEAIQLLSKSGHYAEPCPFLREGTRFRFRRGPLEGIEGILLKKKNEFRLVLSVSMLQRSVSVEIDREYVTAA